MGKKKSEFKKVRVNDLVTGKILWLNNPQAVKDYEKEKKEKEDIREIQKIANEAISKKEKFRRFRGAILFEEKTIPEGYWKFLYNYETEVGELLELAEDQDKPIEYVLNNRGSVSFFGENETAFYNALETLKQYLNKENNRIKSSTEKKSIYATISLEIKEYTYTIRITAFVE